MGNRPEDKVKVIIVPCYQDGHDGILNKHYYCLLYTSVKAVGQTVRFGFKESLSA